MQVSTWALALISARTPMSSTGALRRRSGKSHYEVHFGNGAQKFFPNLLHSTQPASVISMDLTINGLQHIGIPVTDIATSEAFYERLGFANVMKAPFTIDGETGTCIMMKRDGMVIELYQLPPKQLAPIKDRNDGHIDHIAFDVPDADQAMATLRHNGFNVVEDSPVKLNFWKKGVKFFFITGPDGERLEFNQVL